MTKCELGYANLAKVSKVLQAGRTSSARHVEMTLIRTGVDFLAVS